MTHEEGVQPESVVSLPASLTRRTGWETNPSPGTLQCDADCKLLSPACIMCLLDVYSAIAVACGPEQ